MVIPVFGGHVLALFLIFRTTIFAIPKRGRQGVLVFLFGGDGGDLLFMLAVYGVNNWLFSALVFQCLWR